jgi:hypothetical protein
MEALGSEKPNTSSFSAKGDGSGRACKRRRRRYQRIKAVSSAAPTTPPTTAPAISPALELELFWFEPWGAAEAVDDACTVETAFGVASGES